MEVYAKYLHHLAKKYPQNLQPLKSILVYYALEQSTTELEREMETTVLPALDVVLEAVGDNEKTQVRGDLLEYLVDRVVTYWKQNNQITGPARGQYVYTEADLDFFDALV
jgi:hypothetical protein